MMHQTKAEFFIKNYVRYSDELKEKMGTLGAMSKTNFKLDNSIVGAAVGAVLLAAVVVSTIGSSLGLGTCIGALIDMLETV